MQLLNQLENKEITGKKAIAATEDFLKYCNSLQRKWYSRVIKKDLRINVDVKLANSAGAQIANFDVMLATDIAKCKNPDKILEEGCFISPKLDGYRCIAICENGKVHLMSRNGTEYDNFPSIKNALMYLAKKGNFVLDGEIMSDDFNSMQKTAFASKRGTAVGDVVFHVFDIIPYEEWMSKDFKLKKSERIALLDQTFVNYPTNKIQIVANKRVRSLEEAMQYHSAFVARGYEGAMVLPNIPYYTGRKSNSLLKIKDMVTQDCTVVGMYEGTGRNAGRLGGLHVIQENGKACDVGIGFTDRDRDDIWLGKENVSNRVIEVKYQELSKDGIMRFPCFVRWRDSGDGNKR
jgi:ATP-dependent DNA ligase